MSNYNSNLSLAAVKGSTKFRPISPCPFCPKYNTVRHSLWDLQGEIWSQSETLWHGTCSILYTILSIILTDGLIHFTYQLKKGEKKFMLNHKHPLQWILFFINTFRVQMINVSARGKLWPWPRVTGLGATKCHKPSLYMLGASLNVLFLLTICFIYLHFSFTWD